MIGDLLDLRKELQSAASEGEQKKRALAFRNRVEFEITKLLKSDPNRRCTFEAIRKRLGVFAEDDPDLKKILFEMGALVHEGEGEAAIWELPDGVGLDDENDDGSSISIRRILYRIGSVAIVGAIVLVAGNLLTKALTEQSLFEWVIRTIGQHESYEECVKNADGKMVEILKCQREHGFLQSP